MLEATYDGIGRTDSNATSKTANYSNSKSVNIFNMKIYLRIATISRSCFHGTIKEHISFNKNYKSELSFQNIKQYLPKGISGGGRIIPDKPPSKSGLICCTDTGGAFEI